MRQVIKEENIIHIKEKIQTTEAKAELLQQILEIPDKVFKINIKMWKEWITCVNRWEI